LRSLLEGIANLDRKIEEAAGAHPDFFIFESLPGAGAALAPRLLAALGSQRGRYGSADEIQKHSGDRTGDGDEWEEEMGAFPLGLRQVSAAKFSRMRGTLHCAFGVGPRLLPATAPAGQDHHAAVRALAFEWIRIVFRCWQDRVAYDENKYLAALTRRGSPLNSVVLAATATTV